MKAKRWIIGAVLGLLALGGGGVALAQLANSLNVSSAPSGSAPAIRAGGIDANISINLVPKGSGTVQVNGTPIVVNGGTVPALTIDPGPLTVNGSLLIEPGTNGTAKGVGARIFHTATDAPTTGTVAETLYTFNLPANTLTADGQSLLLRFTFITAANGNNKNALLSFGATNIWSTGQGAFNNNLDAVTCQIFRTGAATQKSICAMSHFTNAAVSALGGANTVIGGNGNSALTTPGETLSGTVTILARALTPTAAADLTAKSMTVDWYPVGQ